MLQLVIGFYIFRIIPRIQILTVLVPLQIRFEERRLAEDIKENEEMGTLIRDRSKSKSSPFVAKQDLTLVDIHSTTRTTYTGAQIPQDTKGKREEVYQTFITAIILIFCFHLAA